MNSRRFFSKSIKASLAGLLFAVLSIGADSAVQAEPLKLAYTKNLYSAQTIIAIEKGLFAKHQIEIEPSVFASGRLTLDAVMGGAVDLACSSETPITAARMTGQPIAVFARLLVSAPILLVNSGAGINQINDLRGKKIGISAGTGNEVALYEVLRRANIKVSEVTLVNLRPEDMPAAFARGSVDAINNYQPVIFNAQQALGDKAKVIDTQGVYAETFNLVGTKKFAETKGKLAGNALAALIEAETFMKQNKAETLEILSRVIGLSPELMEQAYGNFAYDTAVDPKIDAIFRAHSQWRLDTGNVPPGVTAIPDFQSIIDPAPLKSVAPDRVTATKS